MKELKAALIQADIGTDPRANLTRITDRITQAAQRGVGLVMLPEVTDYVDARYDISVTEEFKDALRQLSGSLGIYLHAGSIHEYVGDAAKPYNTTFVYGPDGKELARYRKLHMFDVDIADGPNLRESDMFETGCEEICFDTEYGRMGLSICFDLRFPDLYHTLAVNDAGMIFCCANFTDITGRAHWEVLIRARAIETGSYVLACGQCGMKKDYRAYGHSMVADPWGKIIAQAGDGEEIIYATLDPDYPERARRQIPVLRKR